MGLFEIKDGNIFKDMRTRFSTPTKTLWKKKRGLISNRAIENKILKNFLVLLCVNLPLTPLKMFI